MLAKLYFLKPPSAEKWFPSIGMLGFLGSAFIFMACGSSQAEFSQPPQSERQVRFLREMQKKMRSLQANVAELKHLQKEMQQLKQLERNQNRLFLEYQERFEERMAQIEQNLDQNNLKLRKLTGEQPALNQQTTGFVAPALPAVPEGASNGLEEARRPLPVPEITESREGGVEELFESGLALHGDQQYLEAIRIFEKLRQEYPDHPNSTEGHYLMGDAYFALQDYTNAAIVFYEFTDENPQYPNAPDAKWKLAQSLEKSGEIGLALDIYQEMLAQGNPYREQAQEKLQIYEKQSQ